MGFFLTLVSLMQVYFVITSRTSQVLYLRWAIFLQRLILARSSSLLNYKFNTFLINNNIYILQIDSASLILVSIYLLPLHSGILLSAVNLFHWASCIPSQSLRSSHQFHPWQLLEIPVCYLCPGWVGVVVWGGGGQHSPFGGSNHCSVPNSRCPRK